MELFGPKAKYPVKTAFETHRPGKGQPLAIKLFGPKAKYPVKTAFEMHRPPKKGPSVGLGRKKKEVWNFLPIAQTGKFNSIEFAIIYYGTGKDDHNIGRLLFS